jgi:hypothetical protein
MKDSELNNEDILERQIRQLKEAVAVMENRNSGSPGIKPDEMWAFMKQKMDDTTPMHPRIIGIFNGHVELEQVKTTLKRLENDLNDLKNVNENQELYDPMEHKIETEDDNKFHPPQTENKIKEDPKPSKLRDKNQRPLSAYQNPSDN